MTEEQEPKPENDKPFEERLAQSSRINNLRWKNRRRMAWIALISMLIVTYWALFKIPVERIEHLDDIITFFYLTMSGIIMGYLGFATLDDKWKK